MERFSAKKIFETMQDIGNEFAENTAVEVHCSGRTFVTGCGKITEYTDNKIQMKCKSVTIEINGEKLNLLNLINGRIGIKGRVKAVNFIYD